MTTSPSGYLRVVLEGKPEDLELATPMLFDAGCLGVEEKDSSSLEAYFPSTVEIGDLSDAISRRHPGIVFESIKSIADVDWLVPHQANKRILDSTAAKLGIALDKVVVTVDRHANTSAASIPLSLSEAASDDRIKRGDLVLMEAMGAGFTWAAAALRW